MEANQLLENVHGIAREWAADRRERQLRRHLERADFDRLAEAGFLLTGVRNSDGGLWANVAGSTRPLCQVLRALAAGDPSVALVSSMHPAVLAFWLATPTVASAYQSAWEEQVSWQAQTALDGHWWGTITSEPGSGGDIAKTKTEARAEDGSYRISGMKHFGSGSGISSYMITSGLASDTGEPDLFFMDLRDAPWDGSTGVTLVREWDGMGMSATQSHAMEFKDYPATRAAWPGHLTVLAATAGAYVACSFTAVIVGIVDAAMDLAREQVARRSAGLRPYEQVEWTRAELEAWLIVQAYEGMLVAVETNTDALLSALRGKTAIAELAESLLSRLAKVLGGGTFSQSSPFSHWYEDVRALGFLRPPWGLAFDQLFLASSIHQETQ